MIPGTSHICPFCGYEYFDAPGAPRHDLDHFLPISRYPFAGANLRNLVPAGDRCNRVYKGSANILVAEDGHRRRCFDPYGAKFAAVSLEGSDIFARRGGSLPAWNIDIGDSAEAATWNAVWKVKERYRRDVLDADYHSWLTHFAEWCRRSQRPTATATEIRTALRDYVQTVIQEGFSDRGFLKRALFEMLSDVSNKEPDGNRLISLLIDLTSADEGRTV
jgi:hypothetical protein